LYRSTLARPITRPSKNRSTRFSARARRSGLIPRYLAGPEGFQPFGLGPSSSSPFGSACWNEPVSPSHDRDGQQPPIGRRDWIRRPDQDLQFHDRRRCAARQRGSTGAISPRRSAAGSSVPHPTGTSPPRHWRHFAEGGREPWSGAAERRLRRGDDNQRTRNGRRPSDCIGHLLGHRDRGVDDPRVQVRSPAHKETTK